MQEWEDVIDDLVLNTLGIFNDGHVSVERDKVSQIFRLATFDHVGTTDITFARRVELEPFAVAEVDRVILDGLAVVIVTIFAAHSVAHNVVGTIEVVHFTKHTLERPEALCAFELLADVGNKVVADNEDTLLDILNRAIRVLQTLTRGGDVAVTNGNVEFDVAVRQETFDHRFVGIVLVKFESVRANTISDIAHDGKSLTTIRVAICFEQTPIATAINGIASLVVEVSSTTHNRFDLEVMEQTASSIDESFAVGRFDWNHNLNSVCFVGRSRREFSDLTDLRGINVSVVSSLDAVVEAIDDKVITISESGLTAKTQLPD